MEDLSVSDAALAARAAGGEVEALAGLLERYRPSLYAAAIGLLRNREEAADAVQDTCLTAVVHLGSLRDPTAAGVPQLSPPHECAASAAGVHHASAVPISRSSGPR